MTEYEFVLTFALPKTDARPDEYLERLAEEGCDDALVGVGRTGLVALDFSREANSARDAVVSAIADVKRAVPRAALIEATPDLVGLTEVAEILGFSRQYMRKLMLGKEAFPPPVHQGRPSIWHLANVLRWLRERAYYEIKDELVDVAQANMQANIAADERNADPSTVAELRSVLG